jgi:hypothetical protein
METIGAIALVLIIAAFIVGYVVAAVMSTRRS